MYPTKFEDLIQAFNRLPGVGLKTAERYAFTILSWEPEILEMFLNNIKGVKDLKRCEVCGNLSESELCPICSDPERDKNMICIVENPKNLSVIEQMREYNGVYHVLNGTINTQKGIMPDQLNIEGLIKRITPDTEEVIIALDPTVEGETTSLYLTKLLEKNVKITRLAYGIPMGSHLDYADSRTISKAFEGRQSVK